LLTTTSPSRLAVCAKKRKTGNVAGGKDVGHIGTHLFIDLDASLSSSTFRFASPKPLVTARRPTLQDFIAFVPVRVSPAFSKTTLFPSTPDHLALR